MSTANAQGHPGLSFGGVGLRRGGYPPPGHLPPSNKPSPSLSQHTSPYQPQAYTPQQPSQGQYPHHLFNPTAPQIPGVASVQNAARPPPPQGPPTLPGPRGRAPPPRQQMQQQPNPPLGYLQQSLNQQHIPQQPMNPQQLSQQSMSQQSLGQQSLGQQSLGQQSLGQQSLGQQSLGQQSLGQQSLGQHGQQSMNQQSMNQQPMGQQSMSQQPLSQPMSQSMSQPMAQQSMSQQSMSQQSMNQQPLGPSSLSQQQPMSQQLHLQPMSQPPMTQSMSQQQSLSQPAPQNDNSILSQQSTPRSTVQPSLPPAPPQLPQVQQVQKVQQVQQVQQQPTPPQPEPAEPAREDHHHEDDIEMGSQDEGEGDSSLEPKMIDGAPYVPRQPMGPMMSAPPEGGSFPTLEAVHKHVLGYCTSVGYAIVIGRSKKTVPGLKKVLFVCDRAGKPPKRVSPEMRKRKTTSRKCDCQFGFFAIEQRTQWTVRYRPDPNHLTHNHGPSESPLLHPAARKLDTKMVQAVKHLKESGIGVTQTLEILQQDNPHVPLLPRDIYNARAAINRNPTKVNAALAEDRPAIYSKPHPSPEDRIRADLRKEIQKTRDELDRLREDSQKEIAELKAKIEEKDRMIEKFEQFIDICNQRVIVRLADNNVNGPNGPASTNA